MGADPAYASVITAEPAPGTVLLPSSDVLSVGQGAAVLTLNDRTRALVVGDTIATGSTGGLFAKASSVSVAGEKVNIGLAPAVLVDAFKALNVKLVTPETV
jgi:hypothetical protein